MKRLAGFTLFVIGFAIPIAAHAQELRSCTPMAPGARCAQVVAAPFGSLDFGAPKPASQADASRSAYHETWTSVVYAHGHSSFDLRAPQAPNRPGCAIVAHRALHSAGNWFAPALAPLPAVQTGQPFRHGHRPESPLSAAPVDPCK